MQATSTVGGQIRELSGTFNCAKSLTRGQSTSKPSVLSHTGEISSLKYQTGLGPQCIELTARYKKMVRLSSRYSSMRRRSRRGPSIAIARRGHSRRGHSRRRHSLPLPNNGNGTKGRGGVINGFLIFSSHLVFISSKPTQLLEREEALLKSLRRGVQMQKLLPNYWALKRAC